MCVCVCETKNSHLMSYLKAEKFIESGLLILNH